MAGSAAWRRTDADLRFGPVDLPLSALLARTLADVTGDLTSDFTRSRSAGSQGPSVAMWLGFLRVVTPEGVAQRSLPDETRLSRRAIRQATVSAEGSRWVSVDRDPSLAGPRVRLTAAGGEVGKEWQRTMETVEHRWATRLGPTGVGRLRGSLESIVGRFDLELPHYPISYGASDTRVTGGTHRPGRDAPRIPPHGQDWSPVLRREGDSVSGLGLTALLGQALVGFTIDYEAFGLNSLLFAEGLTRGFPDDGAVPLNSLPHVLGVTGSGRSSLERHGYVAVPAAGGRPVEKLAALTPRGQQARDAYGRLVWEVEAAWRHRYGAARVTALRDALEHVDARLPPGLPHQLMVTTLR